MFLFDLNLKFAQLKQISLEDFFRNPERINYKLSPDGKYYSYLTSWENRLNIFVREIATDKVYQVTNHKDKDIFNYGWKGNNKILFLQDTNGDENYKLYSVDKDGENFKMLTPSDKVRVEIIDDLEEVDDYILIGMNSRNPQVFDVYKMNVNTGDTSLVAINPGNIIGWLTDHKGNLRIAVASDGVNSTILFRDNENEEFKNVITTNFRESIEPLFFTFDNKYIYASSNLNRDKAAIVKFDLMSGKEMEVIYENPEVDVDRLNYSKNRKTLLYASFAKEKREYKFFDEIAEKRYESIKSKLGDYEIAISGSDKKEEMFLVRTYSDRSMGTYFLYNKISDELTKLADVSPWINENELAPMKPISYTSRDGLKINGYLTLPLGVEPKNLPVVINVHGGPWARDFWTYNPEVQFLANRGFAVMQVNYRGSTGYGKSFWEASFKQWGLKMQDDISDGVKWLIDKGIADAKRIGIYGGSYGGYATLAGLSFSPELYACGVDYVGVSNLFTFMKTFPPYWEAMRDMMYEMVGNPEKDEAQFKATSPVFHADKIVAPLFIAQGKMDPRVNINESDQMVEAMKKKGLEVEYMVKDNEGHGFRNQENKFDFYQAMEKFLEKYLKKD